MHALWHTGLFLLYIFSIDLVIFTLPLFLIELYELILSLLARLFALFHINFPDLRINAKTLKESVVWLGGLVTMIFVWRTYLTKIGEDHNEKSEDVSALRADVRSIFKLLQWSRIVKNVAANSLAASVAIDMLAISALIKFSIEWGNWFAYESVDKLVFGLEIFVTVFLITIRMGVFARNIGSSPARAVGISPRGPTLLIVLVILRLLEPVLVFCFMMRLFVALTVEKGLFDVGLLSVEPSFLLASIFLTISLVVKQGGYQAISTAVKNGIGITSGMSGQIISTEKKVSSTKAPSAISQISYWVKNNTLSILIVLLVLFSLVYANPENVVAQPGQIHAQILHTFGTLMSVLALIILYVPGFGFMESKINRQIQGVEYEQIWTNINTVFWILMSVLVLAGKLVETFQWPNASEIFCKNIDYFLFSGVLVGLFFIMLGIYVRMFRAGVRPFSGQFIDAGDVLTLWAGAGFLAAVFVQLLFLSDYVCTDAIDSFFESLTALSGAGIVLFLVGIVTILVSLRGHAKWTQAGLRRVVAAEESGIINEGMMGDDIAVEATDESPWSTGPPAWTGWLGLAGVIVTFIGFALGLWDMFGGTVVKGSDLYP